MQGRLALIKSCSPIGEVRVGMCECRDWGAEGGWMEAATDSCNR